MGQRVRFLALIFVAIAPSTLRAQVIRFQNCKTLMKITKLQITKLQITPGNDFYCSI